MRKFINILIFIGFIGGNSLTVLSQLTIYDCGEKAKANYPLVKQYGLIEQSKNYTLSNAAKAYLPQFQVDVKATYQSETLTIPLSIPGIDIPVVPQDQYRATIEASQVLWDGGLVRSQKKMTEAGSAVETKQVEVELYALEERVNQLFFGILLFDVQWEQNRILQEELQRNYNLISSYLTNGVADSTDLSIVKVEQLNAQQLETQIQAVRQNYIRMLSAMLGEEIDESVRFLKPDVKLSDDLRTGMLVMETNNRPELSLFDSQNQLLESKKTLVKAGIMPKLHVFFQGGYGRPGLNMLSEKFDFFYVGGLGLTWNPGAFYTQKNDLRKIEISRNQVDVQRDIFLYNIRMKKIRECGDIEKLMDLMEKDEEIVLLRENIRKSAEAKVAGGILTVTEWMREVSRENLAKQTKAAHEIDLLKAIYDLKNTLNNH